MEENSSDDSEYIQCYGFCGDPAAIRGFAQNLLHIVNAGSSVNAFIEENSKNYLSQKNEIAYENIDVLNQWILDARESIVTLATTIALGCRRLFESSNYSLKNHRTVTVGIVKKTTSHDKHISGSDLDFINACSRIIHAKEWRISTACNLSRTPGSALEIKTDSDGEYEICLSGFSFAAWMMTKDFNYEEDGQAFVQSPPNLIITPREQETSER